MSRLLSWVCALGSLLILTSSRLPATTLPPELKAYDFAQAYYVEDGGVVIAPYAGGFYCPDGIETPEGIRVMPGVGFAQLESDHHVWAQFVLLRTDGHRAYFHEVLYHYHVAADHRGKLHPIRDRLVDTDNFYLTRFRALEWFDFAFPGIELHPGLQEWRTR